MLGFTPVGAAAAAAVDPDLVPVDAALAAAGYDELHALVDDWMVVRVEDPNWAGTRASPHHSSRRQTCIPRLKSTHLSVHVHVLGFFHYVFIIYPQREGSYTPTR